MIYRDEGEQCPRCGIPLLDARAARGCEQCGGLWIAITSLQDMISTMQMPPEPAQLPFVNEERQRLPCPHCHDPMLALLLHGISVDLCSKQHGVWFDAHELAAVLLRSAPVAN